MSVSLVKGQKVSLKKLDGGENLHRLRIGMGWRANENNETLGGFFRSIIGSGSDSNYDLDSSVFLLKNGRLQREKDIVAYFNLHHNTGAVEHMGDNLVGGSGKGNDDEQIVINLDKLPSDYDKLIFVANIFQAKSRRQHFGMVRNAFIRLVNDDTGVELCRYNLTDDYDGKTAMIFGELYRHNGEFKFNPIGEGTNDGSIKDMARIYEY
jgi:stress response protein SCP2